MTGIKDNLQGYYAQGKDTLSGYIEQYNEKQKQKKDDKAASESGTGTTSAATAGSTPATGATSLEPAAAAMPADEAPEAGPSTISRPVTPSAVQKYKDRLAFKVPMGQFDIENATALPLNISLNHVGPLYYDTVKPGEVFSRETGKVWFTIEVRLHLGPASEYTKWSVAWPIMLVAGPSAAAISLAAIPLVMLSTGAISIAALTSAAVSGVSSAFASLSTAVGVTSRLPFMGKYKQKAISNAKAQGQDAQKFAKDVYQSFQEKGGIQGFLEHLKTKGGDPKLIEMPEQPTSVHDISGAELAEVFDTGGSGPKGWKKSRWQKLAKALEEVKLVDRGWYAGREPNLRVTGGPRIVEIDNLLPKKEGEKRTILEIWPLRLEKVVQTTQGELVSEELVRGEGHSRDVEETVREAAEELRDDQKESAQAVPTKAG